MSLLKARIINDRLIFSEQQKGTLEELLKSSLQNYRRFFVIAEALQA